MSTSCRMLMGAHVILFAGPRQTALKIKDTPSFASTPLQFLKVLPQASKTPSHHINTPSPSPITCIIKAGFCFRQLIFKAVYLAAAGTFLWEKPFRSQSFHGFGEATKLVLAATVRAAGGGIGNHLDQVALTD